jgi:DNA mismatch endonuclease, patch repair protein
MGKPALRPNGVPVRAALSKSEQMARVRSRDTKPEMLMRKALAERGVRYRLHRRDIPGTPDVYIPRLRLAVFVNGCFWHGHDCPRGKAPSSNVAFWREKIEKNKARDERTQAALGELGVERLILWTCRIGEFIAAAERIARRYREAPELASRGFSKAEQS